ncbi:hypothetical protein TEA_024181 [Camellia sinensis var. sinensis]|uniref:Glycosyltransferase n=1 Tax=Camellia sinensis var. sinensis TaxID=542762 RepID=A0A4S4DK39_CAMSN|nr:hypothetical protein TEA_024181 [Camellia sinensis var. sinensis]
MEATTKKPHAVCFPMPFQGHVTPFLKLAELLHHRGFHITFVNSEFNHRRLLESRGPAALDGSPDFRFASIPDGLPPSDDTDATQEPFALCASSQQNFLGPFRELLAKLNDSSSSGVPLVSCLITDGVLTCTLTAAEELGIPSVVFWTLAACGFLGYKKYPQLIENGLIPLKEGDVLDALSAMFPSVYAIGPLQLQLNSSILDGELKSIGSNFWKEETECIKWLNTKPPKSAVYVNFGSIIIMSPQQMAEFAWGLANSNQTFLWIIRYDLLVGESAILPPEFWEQTKETGYIASWCSQEQVPNHPSIGGFLTHNGWNSTLESISSGVPMICWPFFANQQINCRYCCAEWGVGMEIDNNVKRDEVEKLVRELMEGEKGLEMKKKAMEWKKMAAEANGANGANAANGSSSLNLDKLVKEVLLSKD